MSSGKPADLTGLFAPPWGDNATVGRTDQGVDVTQSRPFVAFASGVVTYIDPNFFNGTPAVYVKLNTPITVNGHTYDEVYYSETKALVHVGQRVSAGTPIIAGGNAEIGFAKDNLPAAHATYHEGDVTQAGRDFLALVKGIAFGASGTVSAVGPDLSSAASAVTGAVTGGIFGPLEGWLTGVGKTVLAYLLLAGVAAGLFLTGLKGLGVKPPKVPTVVPV